MIMMMVMMVTVDIMTRMAESKWQLAKIASELEMIQGLQDAECQNPENCMHT